jgi:hypothetical protein
MSSDRLCSCYFLVHVVPRPGSVRLGLGRARSSFGLVAALVRQPHRVSERIHCARLALCHRHELVESRRACLGLQPLRLEVVYLPGKEPRSANVATVRSEKCELLATTLNMSASGRKADPLIRSSMSANAPYRTPSLHHMRNVVTAVTASARRSRQTGFPSTGAPGTTLWMRARVSRSSHAVTKTIGTSHASRSL